MFEDLDILIKKLDAIIQDTGSLTESIEDKLKKLEKENQ